MPRQVRRWVIALVIENAVHNKVRRLLVLPDHDLLLEARGQRVNVDAADDRIFQGPVCGVSDKDRASIYFRNDRIRHHALNVMLQHAVRPAKKVILDPDPDIPRPNYCITIKDPQRDIARVDLSIRSRIEIERQSLWQRVHIDQNRVTTNATNLHANRIRLH